MPKESDFTNEDEFADQMLPEASRVVPVLREPNAALRKVLSSSVPVLEYSRSPAHTVPAGVAKRLVGKAPVFGLT